MNHSGKPLDFHDGFLPFRSSPQVAPTLKTTALTIALVLYVLGFVALYPLAQASVAKSAAEGNDPALLNFVGP
jgi:hypothetical protein